MSKREKRRWEKKKSKKCVWSGGDVENCDAALPSMMNQRPLGYNTNPPQSYTYNQVNGTLPRCCYRSWDPIHPPCRVCLKPIIPLQHCGSLSTGALLAAHTASTSSSQSTPLAQHRPRPGYLPSASSLGSQPSTPKRLSRLEQWNLYLQNRQEQERMRQGGNAHHSYPFSSTSSLELDRWEGQSLRDGSLGRGRLGRGSRRVVSPRRSPGTSQERPETPEIYYRYQWIGEETKNSLPPYVYRYYNSHVKEFFKKRQVIFCSFFGFNLYLLVYTETVKGVSLWFFFLAWDEVFLRSIGCDEGKTEKKWSWMFGKILETGELNL